MIVAISPRVESNVREISVRIYLDHVDSDGSIRKSDDYDAACSIFIYGTRGFVYNVHGKGFYLAIKELIQECKVYNITTLEGYVLKPHARLIKKECAKLNLEFEEGPMLVTYGRDMVWISVKL